MRLRREKEGVLYVDEVMVAVDQAVIERLRQDALANARKQARICAHTRPADALHDMLIVHDRRTYVRPHKHLSKTESLHIIDGEAEFILFDDEGEIQDAVSLGSYGSGRPFFLRHNEPMFHTLLITSQTLVFHEATVGPFSRADTIFPNWAPDGSDPAACVAFMDKTAGAVAQWRSARSKKPGR